MKRLSITAVAVAAVGFSGVGLANGATPTSITSPDPGAVIYGEIMLAGVVDASATINNVYQNTGQVAWAVRQRGVGLADAECIAPPTVAIVAGNVEGFSAANASLNAGVFSANVDSTGLTAGLYCFALNFPKVGRAFVDFYITQTLDVDINVHPNSDPNPLNMGSGGSTPVAIFGSATFNVYDIDTSTLKLGDAKVKVVGKKSNELCSFEDIGSYDETYFDNLNPTPDTYYDLLCKFDTYDIFQSATAGEVLEVLVTGETTDGADFKGSDVVKIVKSTD